MCPTDASGKYRMNAQIARSPIGGAKKPNAVPAANPIGPTGDTDAPQEITISKNPDGTFHTSEPTGEENDFPDFNAAMSKAAECLGEAPAQDADDQGGAAPSTADALAGMGQ